MLRNGTVIDGKYRILDKIGRGGMSSVYLAINEKANKQWAIKEVRRNRHYNFDIVRKSLEAETNLLKKLSHKNLPSVVDVIDQDHNFLVVMDYIEGTTLEKLVDEKGAQKQEDVVDWAIQLCDVLQYLHTRTPAIVYRDMKPSNIMLKNDGSIVLIDFGTAREYKNDSLSDTTYLGTRGYAAPEQFGGKGQSDFRTDIYCLGATMYHLLTGHNPSEAPYQMYPITIWDSTLSKGLEAIITKCTQNNPNDRFQSVGELKKALESYKEFEVPKRKQSKKVLTLFFVDALLSFTCAGASAGMEYEHMELCSKIFLGYAVLLSTFAIVMCFLFDVKGMIYILRNKEENQDDNDKVCKKESIKIDKCTMPLAQILSVLFICIIASGVFPIKSLAAGKEVIITDTEEGLEVLDDINILEAITNGGIDDESEHDYTIYVVNITIPDFEDSADEYYTIDTAEIQVPMAATITETDSQSDDILLTVILSSFMACVILLLILIVIRQYLSILKENKII
jgi:serine/threonine protein kinase